MASNPADPKEINAVFKRLKGIAQNKLCFDCQASNPTWASVTYGVFLCIDCSATHRSLGVHLTFIRSIQLDTSWTWPQLRAMQVGGNNNAAIFFRQHGCATSDSQQKYRSRAASMYKDKIQQLSQRALKTHGTQVHIDAHNEPTPEPEPEKDFFDLHDEFNTELAMESNLSPAPVEPPTTNGISTEEHAEENGEGPNVECALSASPTAVKPIEIKKSSIGGRKTVGAKKGMGAKKGGFGAQRVKINFQEIENDALKRDKNKETFEQNKGVEEELTKEDEEKKLISMRLAYKDLSIDAKMRDDKLKSMDPKKADQLERLGMGSFGAREISHNIEDVQVIRQEAPSEEIRADPYLSKGRNYDDDFEFLGSKRSDNQFGIKKEDRFGSSDYYNNSSWSSTKNDKSHTWDTYDDSSRKVDNDERSKNRKNYETSNSEDAQKKYGNAKSISSDQFFGRKDPELEMKQNMSKFEGKQGFGSADLYGKPNPKAHYDFNTPDMSDVRESVRVGVTKVAGKLSNLANGVVSSIQHARNIKTSNDK